MYLSILSRHFTLRFNNGQSAMKGKVSHHQTRWYVDFSSLYLILKIVVWNILLFLQCIRIRKRRLGMRFKVSMNVIDKCCKVSSLIKDIRLPNPHNDGL